MDSTSFEARLGADLRRLADAGLRPMDPMAVAEAVIGAAGQRGRLRGRGFQPAPGALRAAWIAAILLLLLLALAMATIGSHLLRPSEPPVQRLAAISGGALAVGDSSTGRLQEIAQGTDTVGSSNPGPDIKAAAWSPDGKHIALALGQQPGDTFWHGFRVVSSSGDIVASLGGGAMFAWSPDSRRLLLLPLEIDIRQPAAALVVRLDAFDPSSGPSSDRVFLPSAIPIPRHGLPLAVDWQPNDRVIIAMRDLEPMFPDQPDSGSYQPAPQGTIWLLDPSGTTPAQQIAVFEGADLSEAGAEAAAFSPDGQSIATVTSDGSHPGPRLRIVELDGRQGCAMDVEGGVSGGAASRLELRWSPDGARIAVLVERGNGSELRIAAADCGGTSSLIVSGSTSGSVVEENSGDLAGADPLRVVSGEALAGPLAWSPDGDWLYYRGITLEGQPSEGLAHFDLRRVRTSGGPGELVAQRVEWFDLLPEGGSP